MLHANDSQTNMAGDAAQDHHHRVSFKDVTMRPGERETSSDKIMPKEAEAYPEGQTAEEAGAVPGDNLLYNGEPPTEEGPNSQPANTRMPRRASRTIDVFYEGANQTGNWTGPLSIVRYLSSRFSYFLCHVALGLVNVGSSTTSACLVYLFASETGFDKVTRGWDGIIACSLYIGAIVGGLLAGPLSDLSGRRKILLIGLFNNAFFGILMAFATAPWNLIIIRFMSGLGLGAVMPCVSSLVAEHTTPKDRGFYINTNDAQWTTGFILSAAFALAFLQGEEEIWSVVFILCIAAPNVLAFVLVYFYVPESFRFLALHGQYEEAAHVANRVARSMSFCGDPLEKGEVAEHYPIENIQESPPSLLEGLSKCKEAYMDLYKRPELRKQVLLAQLLWFLLNMGYGVGHWVSRLFQELDFVENIFLNAFIYALGAVPGLFLSMVAVERMSRDFYLKSSLFATLFSVSAFALLSSLTSSTIAIVTAAAVFHSCLITCWSSINLVTTEAFKTSRRSAVLGVCGVSGNLGLATMNLLSAAMLRHNMPVGLLIVGSASFILSIVAVYSGLLPIELKGASLKDMSIRNLARAISASFSSFRNLSSKKQPFQDHSGGTSHSSTNQDFGGQILLNELMDDDNDDGDECFVIGKAGAKGIRTFPSKDLDVIEPGMKKQVSFSGSRSYDLSKKAGPLVAVSLGHDQDIWV